MWCGGPLDGRRDRSPLRFHLHTNHFQIAALSHGAGIDYDVGDGVEIKRPARVHARCPQVGDWRDTISLPTPGNVTIRFRAADFHGRSLAHCHIFSHSDTGMYHEVNILPPP